MVDLFRESGEPTADAASARFNTGARNMAGGPARMHFEGFAGLHRGKRGILPRSGLVKFGATQQFRPEAGGGEQLGDDAEFGLGHLRI